MGWGTRTRIEYQACIYGADLFDEVNQNVKTFESQSVDCSRDLAASKRKKLIVHDLKSVDAIVSFERSEFKSF